MAGGAEYRIEFSIEAEAHLAALKARERPVVRNAVTQRLLHQPTVETTNRKPMRQNKVAAWELRVGQFRVYYDVETDPEFVVYIRAVGVKERNQVYIGGKAVEL